MGLLGRVGEVHSFVFLLAGLSLCNARDASFLAAKAARKVVVAAGTKALGLKSSDKELNAKDMTFLAFHGKGLGAFARMDNPPLEFPALSRPSAKHPRRPRTFRRQAEQKQTKAVEAKQLRQQWREQALELARRNTAILAKREENMKKADKMKIEATKMLDNFDMRSKQQWQTLPKHAGKVSELANISNTKGLLDRQQAMGEGAGELARNLDQYGKDLKKSVYAADAIQHRTGDYHKTAQKKIEYSIEGAKNIDMERSLQDWYEKEGVGSDEQPLAPGVFSQEGGARTIHNSSV